MPSEVHSALVTRRRGRGEEDGGPSGRRGRVGGESHKEHLSSIVTNTPRALEHTGQLWDRYNKALLA